MSFTKQTTFTDKLDEEIYVFRLMLSLAEQMCGKCDDIEFKFNGLDVEIQTNCGSGCRDEYFLVRVRTPEERYDVCEMAGEGFLDIMNCWLPARAMIVRDPKSRYFGKFSVTDAQGDEEYMPSDELLDSYLTEGINNMPEDVYFQEMLVRPHHMYPYEDIDRLLDALKTPSTIQGSFFHAKVPEFTVDDYEKLCQVVLGMKHETK